MEHASPEFLQLNAVRPQVDAFYWIIKQKLILAGLCPGPHWEITRFPRPQRWWGRGLGLSLIHI